LRFNFRGVGKSQGVFDNGIGELSDAASALDWVQQIHPEAETTWVAGVSFGAWIGMQLLMRRPEIKGFISIAPPANMYDFSFLAPCPSSGIIIQGEADEVVTPGAVQKLVDKLRTQRHITIHHDTIPGANHFFANELDLLMKSVDGYLDMRLGGLQVQDSRRRLDDPHHAPEAGCPRSECFGAAAIGARRQPDQDLAREDQDVAAVDA
jgi:alpha/beta superfamily hydrolase